MSKHLSHLELQKIIKKDRRRSKKTLFILLQKPLNCISVFYKEPQQDKKLFIAFDVVINLEIFDQQRDPDQVILFSDFNTWRIPLKVEKQLIAHSQLPYILQQQQINFKEYEESGCQDHQHSFSSQTEKGDDMQNLQIIDNFKGKNYLIEVELDTNNTGSKVFGDFAKVLNSIPDQKAHLLADKIILYQNFVNNCLQSYKQYEKSLTRILPNLHEENILEVILQEQTSSSYEQAHKIISEKIVNNKFVSYLIKVNKEGQQVIQKFGYSKAFLDILGIQGNYEQFFMRRGPINPFNPRNRLDRLIMGLHKKALGYQRSIADKYEDFYSDQEIYTIDNIVFKTNYKTEKHFLNQSDQYFIKSSFLLQITTFDIPDSIIAQIANIRHQNSIPKSQVAQNLEKEIWNLQYNCESEIFLNKYYIH
ncbi:hypothetical protein ABPG74_021624 [Tetrahymena malaccensis]